MPGKYTEPTSPVWACVDCYTLHCNGETDPNMTEAETSDFLARYARGTDGAEVTAGILRSEHSDTCPNFSADDSYSPDYIECDCAEMTFSWSPCGICGSNLGGSRHALTLWVPATV